MVVTPVIRESSGLETRSLLRLSPGGRKECHCLRDCIVEHRHESPVFEPPIHPLAINFFALAGHHGSLDCVEVQWCKVPMCWGRAECLNELPETALASVMNYD